MNIKPLKRLLELYPQKMEQFQKAYDRTFALTSSDSCDVTVEVYNNNIARYIVEGTRSKFSICFNPISMQLSRKPYKEKPWFYFSKNMNFSNIL